MDLLPKELLVFMLPFAAACSQPVCHLAIALVVGAILTPGKRTVSAILRVVGFAKRQDDQTRFRA